MLAGLCGAVAADVYRVCPWAEPGGGELKPEPEASATGEGRR
jgi:hypothetical protein